MKPTQVKPGDGRLIGGRFYLWAIILPSEESHLVGLESEEVVSAGTGPAVFSHIVSTLLSTAYDSQNNTDKSSGAYTSVGAVSLFCRKVSTSSFCRVAL